MNRKLKANGGKIVHPLYNSKEAERVSQQMKGMRYNQDFEPAPGVKARFVEAGQADLMNYATASKKSLKQIFLVHGEEQGAECLRSKLKQAGMDKVVYPYLRQTIKI